MSDPATLFFVFLAYVAWPLLVLGLVFVLVRGLLRVVVRVVHGEWQRCQSRGRAPAATAP